MSYRYIQFVKKDPVGMLSLRGQGSRPDAWIGMAKELADLRSEIAWDDGLIVLLFTGHEDRGFDMEPPPDLKEGDVALYSIAQEIAEFEKPVVSPIGGPALGWGLELVLTSDIRIASETSRFGLPQITLGHLPWEGGTQRLPRIIGRAKALEMVLTGESINATEAYRIGLVHRVVPAPEVMQAAMALAQAMASRGPLALRYAKEAIGKGMEMTLAQGLRLEADLYCILQTTADRTEGIRAYQQKKDPLFKGK